MMDRPRLLVVLAISLCLAFFAAGAAPANEREPDPPRRAYELRVGCAGIAAAAVAQAETEPPKTGPERAEAQTLLARTRDEALWAGCRVGLTAAQVGEAIDRGREGILRRLTEVADEPAALARERSELGRVVVECALFEVIERSNSVKGKAAPEGRRP